MPNFITQSVSLPTLPARFGETEFLETARGRNLTLLRTKSFDSEFFITLKPSGGKVIVKGEKITKPAKIGHLQRALEIFKEHFCRGIISQAFAYKDSSLTEKTPLILGENEILSLVKSSKFDKIFIEIGFGSGRHLLHQARSNQDALLIGIEIYKPAIEQVAKLAIREGLQNIALIATDARVLLSLLPAGCLQRVFLHFPVPWDDAPHRRVISDEFASQIARTLGRSGRFELRTDSEEYFLYAMQKLSPYVQRKAGEISHFKNRDAAVASKYEDRWRKMDKNIYDLIYENKTAGQGEPQQFEMEFLKFDAAAIARNFKNFTFKGEDFFVHFEEIFYFDAQKSLDAGSACEAGADRASRVVNLNAARGGNLTERASVDEISVGGDKERNRAPTNDDEIPLGLNDKGILPEAGGGKILATTAGDKISTCADATQILKKADSVQNINCADEMCAKDGTHLNEDRLSASGINLTDGGVASARNTTSIGTATSAKFSRPAPSEKRALACEQIATSSALNASGVGDALTTVGANDSLGTNNASATIGTIDTNNVPNLDGLFTATRAAEASAAPNATRTDEANATQILKKASGAPNTNRADEAGAKDGANLNEDRLSTRNVNLTDGGAASARNTTNASILLCKNEPQAELQNKSNSIKSQVGYRSEPKRAELQAEHQGKLNRAEQQWQGKPSCVKSQDEWQSEPSCAEPQDVLILLSLGAFDFPQQCFIRANASSTRYFIRRPLPTRENHAAHQKISEIFSQWQR